jgi:DNA-binding PucR family transcriptional regulator
VAKGKAARPKAAETRTLRTVLEVLHPGVVEVVAAPGGLDVACGRPVLYDPLDPSGIQPSDIVLCAGVRAEDVADAVERAAVAGASAIVTKAGGAHSDERIAVLAVPETFSWGQLYTLLRAAADVAPSGEAAGGAPLGDLFRLAAAVSSMVGGAVTIEDPHAVVLAYHSGDEPIDELRREAILGRRVAETYVDRYREAGVYDRLYRGEVVRVEEGFIPGLRTRLIAAVRAADEVLGTIWVAEGRRPFASGAPDALKESARIAALHMIRYRASEDLERRRRSELLRAVLEGRTTAGAVAQSLQIDANEPVTLVAFHVAVGDEADEAVRAQRVADLAALYGEAYRRRTALVAIGPTIYALMPGTIDRARLRTIIGDLSERASQAAGVPVTAAIGPTVDALADIGRARAEADQVLHALQGGGADSPVVAEAGDVWPSISLQRLKDFEQADHGLLSPPLAALERHDAEQGTCYVETLRAYLSAFGDVKAAAAVLAVHPNTFRYRLRRLAEITGVDLNDPDQRLVLGLRLRLARG